MRKGKSILFLMAAFLGLILLAPNTSRATAQGANILQNPGFERPYNSDGAAGSWVRWHRESSPELFDSCENGYHKRPRWGDATDFVHSGSVSQYVGNNWDTWAGGVWQTVNVTPGATYRFTFHARGYGSMDASEPSFQGLQMNIRAGIDPNGSGLWNDGDVVWSAPGNAHDTWVPFSVEAVATGSQMTVFTHADWGVEGVNQCYKFLNIYFDSAELVELGPPPTNTPPPPPPATNTPLPPTATPTPENTPTPTITPTPTATATATPIPGAVVCVNAFADLNANGTRDVDEGYMAGVTFSVSSAAEVVGEGVSPGNATGVCFEGLPTGTYQVSQQVPARLEMTTAGTAELPVEEGRTYSVEFGSRLATNTDTQPGEVAVVNPPAGEQPTTASETGVPSSSNAGLNTGTLIGLGIAIVGVILLGGLLFMALRRA